MAGQQSLSRRRIVQLMSAGFAASTAGCSGFLNSDEPGIQITYTDRDESVVGDDGYPGKFNDWQEETVEDAENQVTVEGNLNDGRYEDVISQVRAGEQPADVIGVDIVRLGDFHSNFEMLADIGDFVESLDYRNDFREGLDPAFFEIDGTTVGVPTWIDCSVLHYNIEHFEEEGLDHPPETWDEFAHAAEVLSDDEFPALGVIFTTGLNMFFLTPFMWANGGGWFDEDGNVAFDSEANIETVEFFKDLQDQGYTTDLIGTDWEDFHNMFYNENLSMIFSTPLTEVEENNEDMFENRYGTAVFPRPEDGEHSSFLGGNTTSIFSDVDEETREASEEFLRWLNTEEGMLTTQELGFLPARSHGYEIGRMAEEPYSTLFEASEQALEVGQTLTHPETEAMGNAFQPHLEEALTGETEVREAMEAGAEAMRELI